MPAVEWTLSLRSALAHREPTTAAAPWGWQRVAVGTSGRLRLATASALPYLSTGASKVRDRGSLAAGMHRTRSHPKEGEIFVVRLQLASAVRCGKQL